MKEIIHPDNFKKIEFWAATTLFVFLLFFHISDAISPRPDAGRGTGEQGPFTYYFISSIIRYTVLYLAFLLLNFVIVPKLVRKEALMLNVVLTLVTFLVIGFIEAVTATSLKYAFFINADISRHDYVVQRSFLYAAWLLLMFGFYSVIKYCGLWLLARSADIQAKYRFITPGGLVAIVMWMIVLFFMFTGDAAHEVVAAWCVIIPFAILFYWYSFHTLIPRALPRKRPFTSYLGRTILVLALTGLPVGLFALLLSQNDEAAISITFLNMAFQLMVIAPFTWVVFQRYIRGNEELSFLKKELGQTNASFDFLRSQINPHFLFNALNTIYGTALQEKAERTSEGIEKLGDMMRFMLQENMQENIPLAREVEYLDNYISLQRLRTDANPIVRIESSIQQPVESVRIAPMLLIPFVENAFKHGISLREPSHIKINLELRSTTLYFDVYNSKHEKQDTDPEKNKSGIGLNNVRQRLELMYPKKHELVIRETGREFFVHLTIQLT